MTKFCVTNPDAGLNGNLREIENLEALLEKAEL